ncbi:diacylglycerol/lipid kinase family protein [Robiginitalea sp.]|uniref:diacylglycerol/lipid kinase family protein n=1 Tax=Robiginitalea sp. TaxID=1902411 RepID=UPI003C3248E8
MKVVFIVNSKNKRAVRVLPELELLCRQTNPRSVQFLPTRRKKHAIELAREAAENGCDYMIAVGGDGTLHEVINGLLQCSLPADKYPAIGLLPCGSANDFARTAKILDSTEGLFNLIQNHTTQKIDLGRIQLQQTGVVRYFINIAGAGLGGEVVQKMEESSALLGPGLNYFWHILTGFLRYIKKEVTCTGGNWKWKGRLLQMAVANGRYFGNALCVAPDARLDDGLFQVTIFGDLSVWDYLKNLGKLKAGVRINHPEVTYQNAEEVLLESNVPCPIEADGEFIGHTPATLSVLPKAIVFLMPPETM